MYRTAKSLEITEVEVHSGFILCSYLLLHKTLILCNVVYPRIKKKDYLSSLFSSNFFRNFSKMIIL